MLLFLLFLSSPRSPVTTLPPGQYTLTWGEVHWQAHLHSSGHYAATSGNESTEGSWAFNQKSGIFLLHERPELTPHTWREQGWKLWVGKLNSDLTGVLECEGRQIVIRLTPGGAEE